LKHALFALRSGIDIYAHDQHRAPKTLQDLVAKKYLTAIPIDPMTRSKSTWRVVMESSGHSADPSAPGIFDVRSGSDGVSSDGSRYADW